MIRKLHRKFICILMSVVTIILFAVFLSILISTLNNTRRISEEMLRQALFIPPFPQEFQPPQDEEVRNLKNISPPNARTSVLVAKIDVGGSISIITNQLHFIKDEEAAAIVETAMSVTGNTGTSDYELRWMKSEDTTRIAFVDISIEREMIKNLVISALPIGGAALVAFFFISVFLARWAVHPVELAWEKQRRFVADASHELKTPLTVILSNAEMLSGKEVFHDEKKARRMEHIRAEAVRMRKLSEDLLALARSDSAEGTKIQERVDFSFIVTSAVLTFEPIIYDEKKNLSYDIQDNLFVTGDASRLQQLVGILLDNATKYSSKGGQIKVSLRAEDKKIAILTVTNDGDPIPKDELSQVFERFYRVDKSRSSHGSFGLGLSIAEGIAKEHYGKIWAASSNDSGNSFHVSLAYII